MLPTLRVHLPTHVHAHTQTSVSATHVNLLLKHPTGAAEGHVSISQSSQGANRDETWQKDVLAVDFYDIAINMKHLSGEGIVTTLRGFDSFNRVFFWNKIIVHVLKMEYMRFKKLSCSRFHSWKEGRLHNYAPKPTLLTNYEILIPMPKKHSGFSCFQTLGPFSFPPAQFPQWL